MLGGKTKIYQKLFQISGSNNWMELKQEADEGGKKETLLMERPRHHRGNINLLIIKVVSFIKNQNFQNYQHHHCNSRNVHNSNKQTIK